VVSEIVLVAIRAPIHAIEVGSAPSGSQALSASAWRTRRRRL